MKSAAIILVLLASVTCVFTQEEPNAVEELLVETLVSSLEHLEPQPTPRSAAEVLEDPHIWRKSRFIHKSSSHSVLYFSILGEP